MEFIIYSVCLSLVAGIYISFIKEIARCPDGTCSGSDLKTILIKGIALTPLVLFYLIGKIIVLVNKQRKKEIKLTDF